MNQIPIKKEPQQVEGANPEHQSEPIAQKPQRLLSIDALRGFDMIWIVGASPVVNSLHDIFDHPVTAELKQQLKHASWEGFTFLDIIMPLFMFITGCSMVFSFEKRLQKESKVKIYLHVLQRVLILWILGMIYQGKLLNLDLDALKLYSNTLQAIAMGYLGSSLLLLIKPLWGQVLGTSVLLFGYWALLNFYPVPGGTAGDLTLEGNLAAYVDIFVLGQFDDGPDYTWVLSSMTFIVTVMLGCFSGKILKLENRNKREKFLYLVSFGMLLSCSGWLLTLHEPCIKKIWTSSFTLISGGYCVLLLALFYGIIDVLNFRKWAFPFVVVGANAIFAYMVFAYNRFVNPRETAEKFVFGLKPLIGNYYPLTLSLCSFFIMWFVLYWMYQKKTFLKI